MIGYLLACIFTKYLSLYVILQYINNVKVSPKDSVISMQCKYHVDMAICLSMPSRSQVRVWSQWRKDRDQRRSCYCLNVSKSESMQMQVLVKNYWANPFQDLCLMSE